MTDVLWETVPDVGPKCFVVETLEFEQQRQTHNVSLKKKSSKH